MILHVMIYKLFVFARSSYRCLRCYNLGYIWGKCSLTTPHEQFLNEQFLLDNSKFSDRCLMKAAFIGGDSPGQRFGLSRMEIVRGYLFWSNFWAGIIGGKCPVVGCDGEIRWPVTCGNSASHTLTSTQFLL